MPPWRNIPRPEARAALLSLGVGIALTAVKFVAYGMTRSSAIFSDAMENIVNVLASAFAFYALALAHLPADDEHPYGHGKVEFFSAGLEGGLILFASIVIVVKTVEALLFSQVDVQRLGAGLGLMVVALLINGGIGWHLIRTGRRHGSLTLEADGRHLLGDAITSTGALTALALVKFTGWKYFDPLGALFLAAYLGWIGIRLLRPAAHGLMDRQDLADGILLRRILDSHVGPDGKTPRICSYHKLRHRHSGRYHWVDFHIRVPPGMHVDQGHEVASTIEYEIELALGIGNATSHIEPCGDAQCAACAALASAPAL